MLTQSLRRWPNIEIALGYCTVFSDCCIGVTMWVASETPDNTTHWRNADVMLGDWLRRWANIIPAEA